MAPRLHPTVRQVRLGTELRRLREAAGMTAREAAGMLGTNSAHMSQMEAGVSGISEERLRGIAALYACADEALISALVAMRADRTRGWWTDYRYVLPSGFLDLAELEHHATYIRDVATVHVPGLLQTESYARAVFAYMMPELPPGDLEPRIDHRMRRRLVLERDEPAPFDAVIHESVLRTRVGTRTEARSQLHGILTESDRDHVSVRVIPFDVDGFAGADCQMVHVGGVLPRLDTVVRDGPHGTGFIDAEAQLSRYRTLFRKVADAALDPAKSRDFIHRVAKEL
jgi:transcriptional regulator with XRE-family HTH domain